MHQHEHRHDHSHSKLPLLIGGVLIVAAIARHRRRAWYGAWDGEPGRGPRGHHRFGPGHRHLGARLADCAERMAAGRDVVDV